MRTIQVESARTLRATILAAAVILANPFLALATAQFSAQSSQLVPATFAQQADALGFRWDVNQVGAIGDGTNDAFDGGFTLRIGNAQFQSTQRQMLPSSQEYILTGKMGVIEVTRRVKVDPQRSFVRYVESFTNRGPAVQNIVITIYSDLGTTPQSMTTNSGRQAVGALTKKENAIVCYQQPNGSRPSVVMYFGTPRSKVKPSVSRSGDDISVKVSLAVQPGKTVSYLHGGAQRKLQNVPTAKEVDAIVKPLEKQDFLKDLPAAVRRTIVNYGTVLFGGGLGEESLLKHDIQAALGIQPGTRDILAIGEESRLRGNAACENLTIDTRFGKHQLRFEDVAALAGRGSGDDDQIFLRDGQVLTGKVAATDLRFSTIVGSTTQLNLEVLDRLVLHQQARRDLPDGDMYVVTHDGDRVAASFASDARLPLLTMWGRLQVRMAEVAWVVPSETDVPGVQVRLKNGSRFFAYLPDVTLSINSPIMGQRVLETSEIRGLVAVKFAESDPAEDTLDHLPRILLRGGQVLIGRFVDDAVDFQLAGEPLLVPRNEIRILQRREPDDDALLPHTAPLFTASLWSGDVLVGHLRDDVLQVQVNDQVCSVPVRELLEAHVPAAKLTEQDRRRILQLIGKLGEADWRLRNQASRELADVGYLAIPLLRDAAENSSDPEVRRRAQTLLERLGVPFTSRQE